MSSVRVASSPAFSSQAGLASFVHSSVSPFPSDAAAATVPSGAADRSGVLATSPSVDPPSTPDDLRRWAS